VGSLADCTRILGLGGFRVSRVELGGDDPEVALRVHLERRGARRYPCSGCGRRTGRVRDATRRTWRDLPWALHPVTLVYAQRRVICRACGIRTERVEFADPKARLTRRLQHRVGLDCQSMPTSHAALRHAVGAPPGGRNDASSSGGTRGDRGVALGISARTKSTAARDSTSGRCFRTASTAR
jgi:transposase